MDYSTEQEFKKVYKQLKCKADCNYSGLTFTNGLTRTGNNIQLGGDLTENTSFSQNGFLFNIADNNGGLYLNNVPSPFFFGDFTNANGIVYLDSNTPSFSGVLLGNLLTATHGVGLDDINTTTTEASGMSGIWGQYIQLHITDSNFNPGTATYSGVLRGEPTKTYMGYHYGLGLTSENEITCDANGIKITINGVTKFRIKNDVPSYADDAAAITGGLTAGDVYKTTTLGSTYLKIVP